MQVGSSTTASRYASVWRGAQELLRAEMTRAQFDTWLSGASLTGARDGATLLSVRTTFARELLDTRFRERIEAAIADVTGQPCTLRIIVAGARERETPDAGAAPDPRFTPPTRSEPNALTLFDAPVEAQTEERAAPARLDTSGDISGDAEAPARRPAAPGARRRGVGPADRRERLRHALDRARGGESSEAGTQPAEPLFSAARETRDAPRGRNGQRRDDWQSPRDDAGSGSTLTDWAWGEPDAAPPASRGREGETQMGAPGRRGDEHHDFDGAGAPPPPEGSSYDTYDTYEPRMLPTAWAPGAPSGQPDHTAHENAVYASGLVPMPRLNPRYVFSNFIVGSSNKFAHAASLAVSEAPGQGYNPLFLYGGVGLGKTHLLHAIGHTALARNLVVLYVSSETFTNEIINAILHRKTEEFRFKYRSVDVLLVDDIQFIAGKDSTEEEFFHTFNALHEANKQIVMCSDRPPKAIVSLTERLRSRFEWGLIADIQPPDLETRVAILRAKSDLMGQLIPDEVTTYLANRVQSNIRELEGTFNRFLAYAQLHRQPPTLETAKAALASLSTDGRERRVSVEEILSAVSEQYRISIDDLRGKQRDKHIVLPRQVAMYLMRQETDASLLEIGQALGGRDHSTVLHGCEKISREINENTTLRKDVLAIRQQLVNS